jgi:choline dehydrogenase-like flavoprotein
MIHDLGTWRGGDLPHYDVAVVGSGPAGMTVTNELAGSGLRVVVLESGGLRPTPLGDALRIVRSEGIEIRDSSRERVLGGASTTWAGLSSPLDAIDMEARPILSVPGWPIAREELVPYWERATRYRFPPLEMFATGGFDVLRGRGDGGGIGDGGACRGEDVVGEVGRS